MGNNCTVDETVIVDSAIDDDVNCGPRAYLRGHTHLLRGAKAGTHVELKNSVVGEAPKCRTSPTLATRRWAPA